MEKLDSKDTKTKHKIKNNLVSYIMEFISFNEYPEIIEINSFFRLAIEKFFVRQINKTKLPSETQDSIKEELTTSIKIQNNETTNFNSHNSKKKKNYYKFITQKYLDNCFLLDPKLRFIFNHQIIKKYIDSDISSESYLLELVDNESLKLKNYIKLINSTLSEKFNNIAEIPLNQTYIIKSLTRKIADCVLLNLDDCNKKKINRYISKLSLNFSDSHIGIEGSSLIEELIELDLLKDLNLSNCYLDNDVYSIIKKIHDCDFICNNYFTINLTNVVINKESASLIRNIVLNYEKIKIIIENEGSNIKKKKKYKKQRIINEELIDNMINDAQTQANNERNNNESSLNITFNSSINKSNFSNNSLFYGKDKYKIMSNVGLNNNESIGNKCKNKKKQKAFSFK